MITNVYTIWDDAAQEAGPPFCAKTDQVALRQFYALLDGVPTKNDYALMHISSYNAETMQLEIVPPREVIEKLTLVEDKQ